MKLILTPVLALCLSQAASFAQAELVLRINQDTREMDWLAGNSISSDGSLANNWFGAPFFPIATITSPALNHTGDNAHVATLFAFSSDRKQIEGISLGTSLPPLAGSVLSGTAEGPAAPIFTQGDFSLFSGLTRGDYTLSPMFGNWSGGIHVVVVPEPSTCALVFLGLGALALRRTSRPQA